MARTGESTGGAPWVATTGARQAHLDGSALHANVAVAANNRDGLEQLARDVLRPPIAQERLSRGADGRVLLTLKAEWSDDTTALPFAAAARSGVPAHRLCAESLRRAAVG